MLCIWITSDTYSISESNALLTESYNERGYFSPLAEYKVSNVCSFDRQILQMTADLDPLK